MENFETVEALYILGEAVNGIFKLLVAVACTLLLIRERTLATILMFLGSILSIFLSLGSVLLTALAGQKSPEAVVWTNAIFNLVGQIHIIIFAIGIFLFALQYGKKIALLKKLNE